MKIADDTFLGNSECEWVNAHSDQKRHDNFENNLFSECKIVKIFDREMYIGTLSTALLQ